MTPFSNESWRWHMMIFAVLLFLVLGTTGGIAYYQGPEPLLLGGKNQVLGIVPPMEILIDKTRQLDFENILASSELSSQFLPSRGEIINPGFSGAAFWIRFRLKNSDHDPRRYLLEVPSPLIDTVDLYLPTTTGEYTVRRGGELIPLAMREIRHRKPLFFLDLAPQQEKTLYIRYFDLGSVPLTIRLWEPSAFALHSAQERYNLGMYYGAILIILFYNLILFLNVRVTTYVYYVIYGTSFVFWQLTYNGMATEYLWPGHPWLTNHAIGLLISLSGITALQFSRVFLNTRETAPRHDMILRLLMAAFALVLPLAFLREYTMAIVLGAFFAIVFSVAVLSASACSWYRGYRPARYFTIAWFCLLWGTAILGLKSFGVLPSTFLTEYGQQLGSFVEMLLLSLAISDQVNVMKQEREEARAVALKTQREANTHLEEKVRARTWELEHSNRKLEILSSKLAKYLPPQLYAALFSGKTDIQQKPSRKFLTVFFSDIRGFTTMADSMEPEILTETLNFYLDAMARIALDHGGTIDKYIGDAVLVFFGDPDTRGNSADAVTGVEMALVMQERITALVQDEKQRLPASFAVRMGINSGYCTVGNFGSEERLDYTIVGGQVNLANRLEGIADPGGIFISEATWRLVRDKFDCEAMGEKNLKGISHPAKVFRVLGRKISQQLSSQHYEEQGSGFAITLDFSILREQALDEAKQALARALRLLSSHRLDKSQE